VGEADGHFKAGNIRQKSQTSRLWSHAIQSSKGIANVYYHTSFAYKTILFQFDVTWSFFPFEGLGRNCLLTEREQICIDCSGIMNLTRMVDKYGPLLLGNASLTSILWKAIALTKGTKYW